MAINFFVYCKRRAIGFLKGMQWNSGMSIREYQISPQKKRRPVNMFNPPIGRNTDRCLDGARSTLKAWTVQGAVFAGRMIGAGPASTRAARRRFNHFPAVMSQFKVRNVRSTATWL